MEEYKIADHSDDIIYPCGVTKVNGGYHFSFVSEGEKISLLLYHKGEEKPFQVVCIPETSRMGDVFHITLLGEDFSFIEYCYEVDGVLEADPYARMFTGREQWGDLEQLKIPMKSPVVVEEFDWEGDTAQQIPYEDCVIYRAHVRGMTKHVSSNVKDKGTFKALMEKIPYLQKLGITTLELMPVNEFQEVVMPGGVDGNPYSLNLPTDKLNYWGYAPGYYFAPKASYSSGDQKNPVRECKMLVKELHKAGIEVVIELYFDGSQNPSTVLDAARFWVLEYHVDGIHLVGAAPAQIVGRDPYLRKTKLFTTSWDGVKGGRDKNLAEYHDGFQVDMRQVLKGDEDQMNHLILRTRRNPKEFGVINYIANTNGFSMMDMVSYDNKHNEANGESNRDGSSYNYTWNCGVEGPTKKKKIVALRRKQIRNAVLLVFLSQGTPLLLAGDEFGNSQCGNNNSYCQDNEISWLNWNLVKSQKHLYEFTRYAIAFRKEHPVFHMKIEPKVMDYLSCGHPDVSYHGVKAWCPEFENFRRQLGIMYCGEYAKKPDGSPDDYFFVAYNMHWEPHEFALPNLPKNKGWFVAMNTDDEDHNGIYEAGKEQVVETQKRFMVPSRTIVVFIGKNK